MTEPEINPSKSGPKFIFPLVILGISILLSVAVTNSYLSNDAVRGNDGIGIFLFLAIVPYLLALFVCSVILFIATFKAVKYKRNYFALFFSLGALLSLALTFTPITLAPFQSVKLAQLKNKESLSIQGINNGVTNISEGPYKILNAYKSDTVGIVYLKLDGKINDETAKSLLNSPDQDFSYIKLSHDLYVYPSNIDKNKVDDFYTYLTNTVVGNTITISVDPNFVHDQSLRFVDGISNPEMGNTEAFNIPISSIVFNGQDITANYTYKKLTPEQTYAGLQIVTSSPLSILGFGISDDCTSIRLNLNKNVSALVDFGRKLNCDDTFLSKINTVLKDGTLVKVTPPPIDQYVQNINTLITGGLQFNQNPQRYWLKNPTVLLEKGQNITSLFK